MNRPQPRLGVELSTIFDRDHRPEQVPVAVCARCGSRVGTENGTVRFVGERWQPVHRGPCPETVA